jgi:DNA-binding response OmpR family regulator
MPRKVLVADDEPALLRLISRLLTRAGHEVVQVEDGNDALAALRERGANLDVALIDVGLPPSGAGPLLHEIHDAGCKVAAVLISGNRLDAETRGLLDACGGAFLAKPFAPDGLLTAVCEAGRAGE